MARRKEGAEILPHTSIRLENGTLLSAGDESKLAEHLDKSDIERLQNDVGAIAGFVAVRKRDEQPDVPEPRPPVEAGTPVPPQQKNQ